MYNCRNILKPPELYILRGYMLRDVNYISVKVLLKKKKIKMELLKGRQDQKAQLLSSVPSFALHPGSLS